MVDISRPIKILETCEYCNKTKKRKGFSGLYELVSTLCPLDGIN